MAEWLVRDWPSLSAFHLSHPHQGTNGPGHYAQSAAGTHGIGRQSGHRVQGIVGSPVERKWCMLTHQRGGGGRTHAGFPLSASIVAGQGSATGVGSGGAITSNPVLSHNLPHALSPRGTTALCETFRRVTIELKKECREKNVHNY